LKAAQAAAAEPGSDAFKAIHQRHLEEGMREVLAGKKVMQQSLLDVTSLKAQLDEEFVNAQGRLATRTLTLAAATSALAFVMALVALVVAMLR
jgi:hypothetical protein